MADASSFDQSTYNSLNATTQGIGGVAALGNGIAQYFALQSQGNFQLRMAQINQQLANAQADMVIRNGQLAADNIRKRGAANVGSQRAAEAAQGLDVNDANSSGADLQQDTRDATQADITTTNTNAWLQAYGIRANAQNDVTKANIAKIGSNFQAGQTLLTGALGAVQSGFKVAAATQGKNIDSPTLLGNNVDLGSEYSPKTKYSLDGNTSSSKYNMADEGWLSGLSIAEGK